MKKYLIYALALVWMGCGSGMPDHIEECPSIIPQPSQMKQIFFVLLKLLFKVIYSHLWFSKQIK